MREDNNDAPPTAVLPDAFQETPALKDFKSVEALGEAFVNLKQYQGSSIRIPTSDAGEDQITKFRERLADVDGVMLKPDFTDDTQSAEFYKTMGTPDNVDGYAFDDVDGFTANADKMKAFKELALSNNLTKAQANKMAKTMMEQDKMVADSAAEIAANNVSSLQGDWGHAYDQNKEIAIKVAKATNAPEGVIDAMADGTMDAGFTKWMHSLANKFEGEGRNLVAEEGRKMIASPDELKGQIADIMNNKEHPYWVATHPDHSQAIEKMVSLRQKLAA